MNENVSNKKKIKKLFAHRNELGVNENGSHIEIDIIRYAERLQVM